MTMTRALDELETAGVGHIQKEGRQRILRFEQGRKQVWELARDRLRSPVAKRCWVHPSKTRPLGPEAGLSALARYSDLAAPASPVFALHKVTWPKLRKNNAIQVLAASEPGVWELEIWSYSPELFARDGVVDPLSLYLSLPDPADERVEAALEMMMERFPW
jgi:hypothetical protein